jgi:quercetin dioxygenase-like cupin family protein
MNLEEYSQYKETLLHEQPGFACNTYLCTIPQDFPRVDLHWHEQMEIIYVNKGSGSVTVGSRKCPVQAGSIMPILPGELHAIDGNPGVRVEYENIIFSLSLVDNQVENDWARRNILTPLQMGTLKFPRPIHRGTPFHEEVSSALDAADYRLRYASYLLRERPDSIGAIASLCGFDNFSYFIRRFRRKYGMSPREYRAAGR